MILHEPLRRADRHERRKSDAFAAAGGGKRIEAIDVGGVEAALRLDRAIAVEGWVRRVEDAIGFEAVDRVVRISTLEQAVAGVEAREKEHRIRAGRAKVGRDARGVFAVGGGAEDGEGDVHEIYACAKRDLPVILSGAPRRISR